jgi:transposase-like protein
MSAQSQSPEAVIRDIKRQTRKRYNAEEKIRIVLDRLKGEASIAEIGRREDGQRGAFKEPEEYTNWGRRNKL